MTSDHDKSKASEVSAGDPLDGVTRRSFIQTLGLSAAATSAFKPLARGAAPAAQGRDQVPILGPGMIRVALRVNGAEQELQIDPSTTLLEALRLDLDLTGTKEVCDRGACGGCSVLVDGVLTASCMMLAVDAIGTEVTTIEGFARGDDLDPIQRAFIRQDALQCGFCTPGLIVATRALLEKTPKPSLEQIKSGLAGNLCRCGAYTNVFNAVLEASGQRVPIDGEEQSP